MSDPEPAAANGERHIYLTLHRVIDAPVETVYAAWTDPELLRRWLAPGDATVVRAVAEPEVGGAFLIEMQGTDGRKWLVRGAFQEVVPCRRLVLSWCWEGSDVETLLAVEFEPEAAGRTSLTLTHSRFARAEARDEHLRGWNGCLAKLEALRVG